MTRTRLSYITHRILPPVVVFVLFTAGLELMLRLLHVPMFKFPLPSEIFLSLINDRADLLSATWTTTEETLIGFTASAIVGISTAVALSTSQWIRRAFYPYTVFFQTVPVVAIAPLLLLWFDAGLLSVAACAFIVSVFPVIANTLAGLLATDPALVDLFQLYGADPMDRLIKLRLPYALPSIVNGLRVAAGLAVIGSIVGEFLVGEIGSNEGLGVKIHGANKNFHMSQVFAEILLASLLGLALFAAVNFFGYIATRRWKASE